MVSNIRVKPVKSVYTSTQIAQYLTHIRFPGFLPNSSGEFVQGAVPCTLENLELLVQHHLVTFPFENTPMHYTEKHEMDISPAGLFERLVVAKKGFGSYCFGQNELLLNVLRGLGYRAYPGPARVNQTPPHTGSDLLEFTAQSHMVLFIQLPDSQDAYLEPEPPRRVKDTYLVDVGFGAQCLVRPILLRAGSTVRGAAPPEEHRLVRGRHPDSSLIPRLEWHLQYRCGTYVTNWQTVYQFALHETFPIDRQAANFAVSQRPGFGPFLDNVLVVRHVFLPSTHTNPASEKELESDKPKERHMKRLILFSVKLSSRVGDHVEWAKGFSNEEERVDALRELFDMDIPKGAEKYIQGRLAQLSNSKNGGSFKIQSNMS
ncbi:cysteine proteinase [Fomitiporia mediterranea MF3/22]|uniref:cysteine proteinase n=1 Tax=Fomitiporia mediterranea (strain MF3/22) TaxID=694068 RepID=UPI00044099D9|nr:cysteine proteinase [Fomitiporia mediterranea MF3/22]EJD07356.1 cysteine proteinase [Fomitiporia mediterranea MF3/22]